MSFDIVNTLEIPQGATELTTSQLKQISGGHDGQQNKHKHNKCNKEGNKHKKRNKENNCDNNNDDNNDN
jgi:bacteriocin-like protein